MKSKQIVIDRFSDEIEKLYLIFGLNACAGIVHLCARQTGVSQEPIDVDTLSQSERISETSDVARRAYRDVVRSMLEPAPHLRPPSPAQAIYAAQLRATRMARLAVAAFTFVGVVLIMLHGSQRHRAGRSDEE